ncbi:MAG: ferrous iron transport protein B [Bacteroidales bacterium]
MNLFDLNLGEKAVITKVKGRGAFRKRIIEMGFVIGKEVTVVKKAPLRDPVEYNILGYNVSLRNSEARLIEVGTDLENTLARNVNYSGTFTSDEVYTEAIHKTKIISVALVGNPNSGKTTIFNHASGSQERVGNYSGVTIDAKEAHFRLDDYLFNVTDLPGTYSITAYTPEELFVRGFIFDNYPDVVVNVIDASNLERNLYLTTQLIDMDIKVVVALNMYDELQKSGDTLDHQHLGQMLGTPFVPTVGSKGKGIPELLRKIIEVHEDRETTSRHVHINYGLSIEKGIKAIQEKLRIEANLPLLDVVSSRYLSIKLLEKDKVAFNQISQCANSIEVRSVCARETQRIEAEGNDDCETLITDAKYGYISGALAETMTPNEHIRRKKSEIIDIFITHKVWGIPIFIFLMWLTFYGTFKIGQYPMNWISLLVGWSSDYLQTYMAEGMLKDLLIQGIIAGVGGVLTFLPNIVLLYLFISLMEDTGYLARAVFIMDKAMHKIGLHGKSFIPLLMGFGCNVPAILSTRIIESRRDRLITMLINPFMSCSARLPVYILFITAFFSSYQGTILFSMYAIGVLLAILSSLLFQKTLFKAAEVPFVMELPPYRVPTARSVLKHMWYRAQQYLRKIAGIILIASIVIWALGYFPHTSDKTAAIDAKIASLQSQAAKEVHITKNNRQLIQSLDATNKQAIDDLYQQQHAIQQQNSYIGMIGSFIEPAMRPLGFDWKMSVALLSGVAAKEVVVGTLGVLYHADGKASGSLISKLQQQTISSGRQQGKKVFNPLVAFSFMLFILIYFPCIGVVAAIRKESGHTKWAVFVVVYTTGLAYLASLLVFQTGSLFF